MSIIRDVIISKIKNLKPFYTGGSLHVNEERYKVDGSIVIVYTEIGDSNLDNAIIDINGRIFESD